MSASLAPAAAEKTVKNAAKYQYFATIAANLLIVGYGTSCGWPSVSFGTLQSELTPLDDGPLSTEEISWIVSLFCMGGFLGTLMFGAMADAIGRKTYLLLLAIPQIISWALVIVATDVSHLYASRLLSGIAGGGAYIFVPLLVAEIAEDRVRGQLGTIITVSCNVGILFAFIAGNFLPYFTFTYYLIAIPVVFLAIFVWFPESPTFLMMSDEPKKAENALQVYRNCRRESAINTNFFQDELLNIRSFLTQKKEQAAAPTKVSFSDFLTRPARKAFTISMAIFTMNECSGAFILISYTAAIFAESGSAIPQEWSAILVAFIQLAGTYVSTFLIDRVGRKPLLIFSSFGGGLSLIGLGTYLYLNQLGGWELQAFAWVPVVTFSSLVFIASCGTIPISFVIMTEIMPTRIRGVGTSICLGYSWLLAFVLLKYFPIISEAIGLHMCVAFFAVASFSGTLFVVFVMPETKGKSFEEIQRKLEQ